MGNTLNIFRYACTFLTAKKSIVSKLWPIWNDILDDISASEIFCLQDTHTHKNFFYFDVILHQSSYLKCVFFAACLNRFGGWDNNKWKIMTSTINFSKLCSKVLKKWCDSEFENKTNILCLFNIFFFILRKKKHMFYFVFWLNEAVHVWKSADEDVRCFCH